MSYTKLLYHIIFRTKYGVPTICEQYEDKLYRYIWGFIKENVVYSIVLMECQIIFIYL